MAASNGYVSLEQLIAAPRLEEDVPIEGVGKLRVQALTQEEIRLIGIRSRNTDLQEGVDGNLYLQLEVLYGLVQPRVLNGDVDAGLEKIGAMNPLILSSLGTKITELTFRSPGAAYKDFPNGSGLPAVEAATPSGTSS
jgi:hypothetical protein